MPDKYRSIWVEIVFLSLVIVIGVTACHLGSAELRLKDVDLHRPGAVGATGVTPVDVGLPWTGDIPQLQ